jgi:hypothetical protein
MSSQATHGPPQQPSGKFSVFRQHAMMSQDLRNFELGKHFGSKLLLETTHQHRFDQGWQPACSNATETNPRLKLSNNEQAL